jgi:Flp pilus assembly protein TadG
MNLTSSIGWRRFAQYCGDRSGAAAVEFAIVGSVFIVLLLSSFEAGLLLARITMVDHAVNAVAKDIYIGGVDRGGKTQADLESTVCDYVGLFVPDCEDKVSVELISVSDMTKSSQNDPVCRSSSDDKQPEFAAGGARAIMFLRVCLMADVITPGLPFGLRLSKDNNGKVKIISSTAFMNEPF